MKLPWQVELPLWGERADPAPRPAVAGELRRIALGDRIVHYTLRRGRRRTIGLTIDQRGLRVGAPPRAPMGEVEALIRQHAAWVIEKLDAWRDRPAAAVIPLVEGLRFPLLGTSAQLSVSVGRNGFFWHAPIDEVAPEVGLELRLSDPAAAPAVFERALRVRAHEIFAPRMADFCARFAIAPPLLRLTSARTRWGSCSRQSGVRLNWRLVHAPVELIDYVIAHELAHLKEMNHTARFWTEVERLYPDWQAARQRLRAFGDHLPRFG